MKITLAIAAILVLSRSQSALPPQAQNGVIEGIVLDSTTNLPVAGARVAVRDSADDARLTIRTARQPSPIPVSITGSTGAFSISSLELSSYHLTATADGYADKHLGANISTRLGAPITLTAAQATKRLAIRMSKTATVVGRILDEKGRPVVDVPVRAFKRIYNMDELSVEGSVKAARTDDRGEYRLYGMDPGRYYLRATGDALTYSGYTHTYFPGASSIEEAAEIDAMADMEISANWTVKQEATFTVSGRIVDAETGHPPPRAGVALAACSELYFGGLNLFTSPYNPATGGFVLPNVRPGEYKLIGGIPSLTPTLFNNERLRAAETAIVVQDRDIGDVVLSIVPAISISGKVTFDGTVAVPAKDLASVRLSLTRETPPGIQCQSVSGTGPLFVRNPSDPAFHVDGLLMQDYRVRAAGAPPNLYVSKILYFDQDVMNETIHISGQANGSLHIIVRSAGKAHGKVRNADGSLAAGNLAVLLPKQRGRRDLYKRAVVNTSGEYSFDGISPGNYDLFSFETDDPYLYFNPRIIQDSERRARAVTVAEGSNLTIDLKSIGIESN